MRASGVGGGHRSLLRQGLIALAGGLAAAAHAQPLAEWNSGRLSVHARGEALRDVLLELDRIAAVQLKGWGDLPDPVKEQFTRLALAEGVRTLLSRHSFMLIERGSRKPAQLIVLGREGAKGPALERVTAPAPSALGPASDLKQLAAALGDADAAVRIEAAERLADRRDPQALALLRGALNDGNEAVRAVARSALGP